MDNKEFAKLLLCEATELLNESTKTEKKYIDALENKIRVEKRRLSHISDPYKAEEKENNIDKLSYELKYARDRLEKKKKHENEYKTSAAIDNKKYFYNEFDRVAKKNVENKIKSKLRPHTDYEERKAEIAVDKRNKLHYNINERAKKAQNESIAILLTEAALLLNEED